MASQQPRNICQRCQIDLPRLANYCIHCAQIQSIAMPCGTCLNNPPPFNQTYAAFAYEPPVIGLILGLKFNHQLSHAALLGQLLSDQLAQWYLKRPLPQLILPIPLHLDRLKARGFNQALEIARPISQSLCIPLDIQGARRIKPTLAQSSLSAPERQNNMQDAFQILRSYKGMRVAVIDDVITTTHTMRTFCKRLKQAGADHIDVWCVARATLEVAQGRKTR